MRHRYPVYIASIRAHCVTSLGLGGYFKTYRGTISFIISLSETPWPTDHRYGKLEVLNWSVNPEGSPSVQVHGQKPELSPEGQEVPWKVSPEEKERQWTWTEEQEVGHLPHPDWTGQGDTGGKFCGEETDIQTQGTGVSMENLAEGSEGRQQIRARHTSISEICDKKYSAAIRCHSYSSEQPIRILGSPLLNQDKHKDKAGDLHQVDASPCGQTVGFRTERENSGFSDLGIFQQLMLLTTACSQDIGIASISREYLSPVVIMEVKCI